MPTHSLYLTTNNSNSTIDIPSVLVNAVEYLPLTNDFNNYGTNTSLSITASDTANVSFVSSSTNFKSNAYLTSNNITLQLPITFCFWAYTPLPVLNGAYVTLFSIGNGLFTGDCFKVEAGNVNGTFALFPSIRTPSSIYTLSAYNNPIVADKWIHICCVITTTNFIVYVDGISMSSFNPSPKTYEFKTLSSYKYIFGRAGDAAASYFNGGSIRHFARFNSALNATQINSIMNATKSLFPNLINTSSLKPYNKINLNNVKWNINWRQIFGNTEGECRVRVKFVSQSATNFTWSANTGSLRASLTSNYQNSNNGLNLGLVKPEIVTSLASPLTLYLESDTTNTKGTTMIIPTTNTDLTISLFNGNESLMVNVPEYHIWLYFDVEI